MKYILVLALIVAVTAKPLDLLRAMNLREGGRGGKGGDRGGDGEGEFDKLPDGPVEPLTAEDVMTLLKEGGQFAADVQGQFQSLKDKASELTGSEEDLITLGEHVGGLLEELHKMDKTRGKDLGEKWQMGMYRLIFAGVEDQGQCHKILEFLIKVMEEHDPSTGKREAGELEFWQGVAEAGGKEVDCIIGRLEEFIGLVKSVSDAITGEGAKRDEDGHAFEAEVLLYSLRGGYDHVYRQITVFTHVLAELAKEEEAEAQPRSLVNLLREAESLKRRMDSMKAFKRLSYRK